MFLDRAMCLEEAVMNLHNSATCYWWKLVFFQVPDIELILNPKPYELDSGIDMYGK
jgi:hypothetical protein